MKNKYLLLMLVMIGAVLISASCAPAPTPTLVTTVVPTKAALPTVASTVAPTVAVQPTTAPITAPTAAAGPATLVPMNATPALPTGTAQTADDLLEISPQLLKAMIEGGADMIVVDAQPAEAFVLGHIKGAVNVPWDMKIKAPAGLSQTKLLVIYCSCSPDAKASETDAGDVGMQLYTTYGYVKLALLQGGWDKWMELGYPTEKGN